MDKPTKALIFTIGLLAGAVINLIIGSPRPTRVVQRYVAVPTMARECRVAVDQMRLFLDAQNNAAAK